MLASVGGLARPGSFPPRTTKSFALPAGLPLMSDGGAHSLAHVPEDRAVVRGAGLGLCVQTVPRPRVG
jgi:hypothetical protein